MASKTGKFWRKWTAKKQKEVFIIHKKSQMMNGRNWI